MSSIDPNNAKPATSSIALSATGGTATGLATDLVGQFPIALFNGGYLNFEEVFDLRLVCKAWHGIISNPSFRDRLPDWERIVRFINSINTLNVPTNHKPYISHRGNNPPEEIISDNNRPTFYFDPRRFDEYEGLSPYDKAFNMIEFQKEVVSNVLYHFKTGYNVVGWEWMDFDERDNWGKLELSDPARYDCLIGVMNLQIALRDLRRVGGWWDDIFAGDKAAGCFDGMTGSSYRSCMASHQAFFGWKYDSHDPNDLDVSDEKIIEMATCNLKVGEHDYESSYATPMKADGKSESYERILGSHGLACDLLGAWKKDPTSELARVLSLTPPRLPVADDKIYVTWEGDSTEYLCVVKNAKGGGLTVESADGEFDEVLGFKHDEDTWRYE